MINDRLLVISTGQSRRSTNWTRTEMMWSEFIDRLRTPQRTPETIEEYLNMTKAQQGQLKDIGGFVGGALNGTQRKAKNVAGRDLVTLDLDNIASGETENILRKIDSLGAGYAVYSTRSHAEFRPRLRVIMPLDRTVMADEYEPIARKLASYIGLEMCDPTTFEASRLMYWPACSRDSNYVFAAADKPFVSADGILNQYTDWHDVTVWPQVPGESTKAKALLAKQADPTAKEGIVGAFCREFNIYQAIEHFIPHAYETTEHDDRLTYTGGSTVAGAVIYDSGNFLYSHHATDPCSGLLVNAFDLVRLHLYGDQDENAKSGTPPNKLPSYQAMKKLALGNEAVARDLNAHYAAKASDFFTNIDAVEQAPEKPSVDWMASAKLEYDQNTGRPKKTRDNIMRILQHDPLLSGKIAVDDFAVRGLALGALPWNPEPERRLWTDTDDAGVAWYLENKFDITGKDKIDGALLLVAESNRINEVKDYLIALEWDKTPRLDMILCDYLGADDTPYTRAVARKSFAAAVTRVMQPGCKYDYVPVFVGPQGIGKSTFLATLGKDWFSDSLQSFEGKEAAEMIQGVWINELGEMTGYTRSETNTIKQFLSKREDIYRQAYGRRTGRFPRKCVFFGTCNQFEFLKDLTGNRRFWPVDVGKHKPKKNIWNDLPAEVDQIWAEAVMRWRIGEPLYFEDPEIEDLARAEQEKHRVANIKEGVIKSFLEQPVPKNYNSMDLAARRMFWSGNVHNVETVPRKKTCALEIWCEAFGGNTLLMKRSDTLEINQILENLPGWRRNKSNRNYGYCGQQKGFERM